MSWQDKSWNYKGYHLMIEHEYQDDCVKAFHIYYPLNEEKPQSKVAHITPYDSDARTFELYIDCIEAGADPKGSHVKSLNGRAMYTNWNKKSLQDYAIKFIVRKGRAKA